MIKADSELFMSKFVEVTHAHGYGHSIQDSHHIATRLARLADVTYHNIQFITNFQY